MGERPIQNLRRIVAHSLLHRPLMEYRARIAARRIKHTDVRREGSTIYIVSPYKTGTTYIDSLWDENISKHEPFQLYSLRDLKKDFVRNFRKREILLNLKLECSGFFSLFLDKLPKSTIPHKYIYILRPPSKWVGSVMKHFYGLRTIGYNYINEYYWKQLLSHDMLPVLINGKQKEIEKLADDLYKIYFKLLADAEHNPDISFVELKNLDQLALRLGERIGVRPDFSRAWKRVGKQKPDFKIPIRPDMDEKYELLLRDLPKERFFPLDLGSINLD